MWEVTHEKIFLSRCDNACLVKTDVQFLEPNYQTRSSCANAVIDANLGIISFSQWWWNKTWILPWVSLCPLHPSLLWKTAETVNWLQLCLPSKCRTEVSLYEGIASKGLSVKVNVTEANVVPGQTNRSIRSTSGPWGQPSGLFSSSRALGECWVQLWVPDFKVGW